MHEVREWIGMESMYNLINAGVMNKWTNRWIRDSEEIDKCEK